MKTLVLYVFHEYNLRVEYFIKNAIFKRDDTDFIVICNSHDIQFSVPDYVRIVKRKNDGIDFGAWSEGLFTDNLYKNYDTFIFVNSTVIGPFLPTTETKQWTDLFLEGLVGNVKLYGCTINTIQEPRTKAHIQSYLFAMARPTLEYLIEKELFSPTKYPMNRHEAIWDYEIRLSRLIIENGWNIGSRMKHYKDVDFTFTTKTPEEYGIEWLPDCMYYFRLKQYTITPQELIFLKGNRLGVV
jgi:lipopolysaccharide biosynthesis protein